MKKIFTTTLLLSTFLVNAQKENFYKVYTGKAGSLSATIHLCKSGDAYNGYVWFDKPQWPMPLFSGDRVGFTDSIHISAATEPITLSLTGVLNNKNFTGTCSLQRDESPAKTGPLQMQVSNDKTFTSFDYYSAHDSAKLSPEIKNESAADYIIATIWPKGTTLIDNAIKTQIRKILKMPASVTTPADWLKSKVKKSATMWQKTNNKLSPKDAEDMGLSLSVQEETRILVMYENENFITLANYDFAYTGGAHGNYGTALLTINKQNGKQMQLTDVLNSQGISTLPAILDKVARLQSGIKNNLPLDQNNFLVKKIMPAKNFYITTSGIGFLYEPYEIKSFADGEINLMVPFTALTSYLQQGFKH